MYIFKKYRQNKEKTFIYLKKKKKTKKRRHSLKKKEKELKQKRKGIETDFSYLISDNA